MIVRGSIAFGVAVLLAGIPSLSSAQAQRPRAQLTPVQPSGEIRAGQATTLSLKVVLPADVHVQANKPKDPSLIPTVLTLDTSSGVVVEAVTYPAPTELTQVNRKEPLAVLGPEFAIDVRLAIPGSASGTLKIPARLRYQACNEKLCFPPTTGTAEWLLEVRGQLVPR